MKHLSTILLVILLFAVAFLYNKVYSNNKSKPVTKNLAKTDSTIVDNANMGNIAFVELDSLNEQIQFIKNKRNELEAEQKVIETEWQNGYKILENRKNDFLKRGNAITQQEAEKFQTELMQQQQVVDNKKQNLSQKLSEKSYKFLEDIQKRLKDFLNDYNKDKKYQYILTTGTGMDYMLYKDENNNITNQVIQGMNELLKVKK